MIGYYTKVMQIIIGLGNPGKQYQQNRHNVGFMVVEVLGDQSIGFNFNKRFKAEILKMGQVILVKPQTFMNQSGLAVAKIRQFYRAKPEDLWVIHDDLDIKLGDYKIQLAKGPKEHNGLSSIEQHLKTKDFWRVRVGVENRGGQQISGEAYVLEDFTSEEKDILKQVINEIVGELKING